MNVILLGPPGVGKGTQGVLLAEGKSWKHMATGDILRAHRREGTALGQEAQKYMDAGELVPDELIVAMVKDTLEALPKGQGVVFDGFPRTVPQAEALDVALEELDRAVDRVVVLEADDDVLVKRIAGRRSCPDCGSVFNVYMNPPAQEGVCDKCGSALVHRPDDNPETVKNRLNVYTAQTEPLIRFYEGRAGVMAKIPGEGSVEEIQSGIRAALQGASARIATPIAALGEDDPPMIQLKSAGEIELIARGGAIIGDLFDQIGPLIRPGVSTGELDRFADDFIRSHEGAVAAFKGLYGFPGSVCTSVNEEVVHGIPSFRRKLAEGDIISIDVGVRMDGWYSDSARTFPVGEVDEETQNLLTVTEESLYLALEAAVVGNHVGDIGAAVMARVEGTGYGIIRDLVGHGLGRELHEEPQVPNLGKAGHGPRLLEGLVIAIEPMLGAGTDQIRTLEDRWTVITADRARSAHFEHTIAVTRNGPQVLTGTVPEGYRVLPGPLVNRGVG